MRAPQVKRFMPFLEGSRQCIGMSLARLNSGTALAALLSHFSFRLAADVRSGLCVSLLKSLPFDPAPLGYSIEWAMPLVCRHGSACV